MYGEKINLGVQNRQYLWNSCWSNESYYYIYYELVHEVQQVKK